MKYQKIHDSIIERAKLRNYDKSKLDFVTEIHHIIPKCMGGLNIEENTVLLTPKEHYVIHHLLIKIFPNEKGLLFASNMLRRLSINESNWARTRMVESLKGREFTKETRAKMSASAKGKILKQITRDKISVFQKGRKKLSTEALNKYSKNRPQSHKDNISKANKDPIKIQAQKDKIKNLKRITCPHCGKAIIYYAFPKYHGDKCKMAINT